LGSAGISSCRVGQTDGRTDGERLMRMTVRPLQNNVYNRSDDAVLLIASDC